MDSIQLNGSFEIAFKKASECEVEKSTYKIMDIATLKDLGSGSEEVMKLNDEINRLKMQINALEIKKKELLKSSIPPSKNGMIIMPLRGINPRQVDVIDGKKGIDGLCKVAWGTWNNQWNFFYRDTSLHGAWSKKCKCTEEEFRLAQELAKEFCLKNNVKWIEKMNFY